MKLLFLRSNPRKNGFSEQLFDFFVKGAREISEVTDIDITRKDIRPCKGCFHCWTTTPGICIQNDDMKELLEEFLKTDILVLATPLYAYGVSSYCKIFQERTFPLLAPGVVQNENGLERNNLRYPERGPKIMAGVIIGGLKSICHADGVVASLKSYADGFGTQFAGILSRTESYILQFENTKPKTIKNVEMAFYQTGKVVAEGKMIPLDLQEKAALALSPDIDYFKRFSNIYWNHATQVCSNQGPLEEARNLTNRDITILIYEMARGIDPVITKGLKAVFQFEFPDVSKVFCIIVERGTSHVEEHAIANPDLIIRCASTVWVSIILRELDAIKAFTAGDIILNGDKGLFRKLHRFFPPPNT